ncbi:MAG: hypothetical protein GKR89_16470 [Candidatus Latescibacteria bacterium]|nr:hypothetical protein [Candidatus Latescibacterota bacterium]
MYKFPNFIGVISTLCLVLLLGLEGDTWADELICGQGAARIGAVQSAQGKEYALALFTRFADETQATANIDFARSLFDRERPGSLSHFYWEMSGGQFELAGQAPPLWFTAPKGRADYLPDPNYGGSFGPFDDFVIDVLQVADAQLDMGQYDNDGPDGQPNSGDDDGYVDFIFCNMHSVPPNFIRGSSSGIPRLGLNSDYSTNDPATGGGRIQVRRDRHPDGMGGVLQLAPTWDQAVGNMAHEYGHVLGLPDLFDLDARGVGEEKESAGIGYWGLMGHGNRGWHDQGGVTPFCVWSLEQLGWLGPGNERLVLVDEDMDGALFEDVRTGGKVYRISAGAPEQYFLVTYRTPGGSHYERHLPGSGLAVWRIDMDRLGPGNRAEERKLVDLVAADGTYRDAGYPLGVKPEDRGGDNLDFWARQAEYRQRHGGNLGDATDLFDGVVFRQFSVATNPAAAPGVKVGNIQRQGAAMRADLQVRSGEWAGVLGQATTWRDTVDVVGDLTVAETARLRVLPGTVVRFGRDQAGKGDDPDRVELVVQGILEAGAPTGGQVLFTTAGQELEPGVWGGIRVEASGRVNLVNTRVLYAQDGFSGALLRQPQKLSQVSFTELGRSGIRLEQVMLGVELTDVEVVRAPEVGVLISGPGRVVVQRGRFEANGGPGLERRGGDLHCSEAVLRDNGLETTGGANLLLLEGVQGRVTGNRLSGSIGIYCQTGVRISIEDNVLTDHRVGMVAEDSGVYVARNQFVDNDLVALVLGPRVPRFFQFNIVEGTGLFLENRSAQALAAQYNWWGRSDAEGIALGMQGAVDWQPFIQSDPRTAAAFALEQNWPNPFNGRTQIAFSLDADGGIGLERLVLEVFNSNGQRVRRLLDQPAAPGRYTLEWDGRDEKGASLASGVYYYSLLRGSKRLVRRLVLVR